MVGRSLVAAVGLFAFVLVAVNARALKRIQLPSRSGAQA
jgi:hypothetical protein